MRWVLALLGFALGLTACADLSGASSLAVAEPPPATPTEDAPTTKEETVGRGTPTPESGDGGAPEAEPPPTDCPDEPVTWTVGSSTCTAQLGGVLVLGTSRVLGDSSLDDTGTVTVTCAKGKLVTSAAVCEPPKELDVGSLQGCINGYCSASVGGVCGSTDPAKADAICKQRGYAAAASSTTMFGPTGVPLCAADGTGCFVNQNALCNRAFKTVTCRH